MSSLEEINRKIEEVTKKIGEVQTAITTWENNSATKTNDYDFWKKRLEQLGDEKNNLQTEKNNLQTEKNNLQTEKNNLQAKELLLLQRQSEDPRLVRFNLSGTEFVALRDILVRSEWFAKLLEAEDLSTFGNSIKVDGAYFIPRSPMTFQYVLNYLSDGQLQFFGALDRAHKVQFMDDAAFYSLILPVDQHLRDYQDAAGGAAGAGSGSRSVSSTDMSPDSKYKYLAGKIQNIAHRQREQAEQQNFELEELYKELSMLRKSDASHENKKD